MYRRTKIVATLGPATDNAEVAEALVEAGVDVVRLNLSHGEHETHRRQADRILAAAARQKRCVGILADLQGPKIRIGGFRNGPINLAVGQPFTLDTTCADDAGTQDAVGLTYKELPKDVRPGDVLLLADGAIRLEVSRVDGPKIETGVIVGGPLSDHKGINRLGGGLSVAALTDKDRRDIQFAAELGADYLAVSFPREAADIEEARRLFRAAGGHGGLVAKIERQEALEHLEDIMEASDAIMIARGDLGVEIGDAALAGVQKRIMSMALNLDCVVITATQMMQSMVESLIPTRAEVLDVANAVIDGTDAVMLSEESAVGQHPAAAVAAMARVCIGAESYASDYRPYADAPRHYHRTDEAIAKASIDTANRLGVKAIAALTSSGATALWMSRIGSDIPIFAFTPHVATQRKVALYHGVHPTAFPAEAPDAPLEEITSSLLGVKAVEEGDLIIVTMGDLMGVQGATNTLKIIRVREQV